MCCDPSATTEDRASIDRMSDLLFWTASAALIAICSVPAAAGLEVPYGRYLFPWMPALAAIMVITAPFGPIARKALDVRPLRWLGSISDRRLHLSRAVHAGCTETHRTHCSAALDASIRGSEPRVDHRRRGGFVPHHRTAAVAMERLDSSLTDASAPFLDIALLGGLRDRLSDPATFLAHGMRRASWTDRFRGCIVVGVHSGRPGRTSVVWVPYNVREVAAITPFLFCWFSGAFSWLPGPCRWFPRAGGGRTSHPLPRVLCRSALESERSPFW